MPNQSDMAYQDDTADELTPVQHQIAQGFGRLRRAVHPQPTGDSGYNRDGAIFDARQIFPSEPGDPDVVAMAGLLGAGPTPSRSRTTASGAVRARPAASSAPSPPEGTDGHTAETSGEQDWAAVLPDLRQEREDLQERLAAQHVEHQREMEVLKREHTAQLALVVDPGFDERTRSQVKGLVNGYRKDDRVRKLKLLLEYEQGKDQPREDVLAELQEQYDKATRPDPDASDEDRSE
jgi:hypothetical protein